MDRFKDGAQLSDGDRVSIKSDGDSYSLTISNAQASDSGEYKITASSAGGRLSCSASLLVTGSLRYESFLFHDLINRSTLFYKRFFTSDIVLRVYI